MSTDEVGIRLKLETGEAVANANQATAAIDSLGKALEKAAIAGNAQGVIDYANAINKYKSAVGLEEEKQEKEKKPTVLKVVEDATKVISRAPSYIGAIGGGNATGAALGAASDAANVAQAAGIAGGLGTGAMVGLGIGAALVGIGVAANKLSEQWEKQIPQAMDLTAVLGRLTGEYRTNSLEFQRAFNLAGETAAKFGYSVEEGMATVSQLAKLGVSSRGVGPYNAAEQVYAFQRGTGADRESLMRAEAYSARYRAGPNALGYALGGTYAQGLETAQFQEYLNATLRIFEDGLSRGVIKGFDEITRTQNFIALLGQGSPLWKGEQGAQRYQTMNQQFTSASFENDYDVVRYKATEAVLREAAQHGFKNDKEGAWSSYKQYGNINEEGYLAVQRAREGGLTPEIFTETMKILKNEIAAGSYANLTEAVTKAFGVNYTAAKTIIDAFNSGQYKNAVAQIAAPSSAASPEMQLLTTAQEIKIAMANAGADVLPAKVELMSVLRGILAGVTGDRIGETYKRELPLALNGIFGGKNDAFARGAAEKLLSDALKDTKNGVDTDKNGVSDNAEAAMKIIGYLEGLPEDVKHYLDASGLLDNLWSGKSVNDLPGIAEYLTKEKYKSDNSFKSGYGTYTSKEPLKLSNVQEMTNKFEQYMPNWQKQYPEMPIFKQAATDNMPGAVQLFKEITTRVKALESSWDDKITKATNDAYADKTVTKKEQEYIDQLKAGKQKEIGSLFDSIFGPLNTLIRNAQNPKTEGGKEITPDEWKNMLKYFYPQAKVPESNPTVQLSRAEAGQAQAYPVSLSLSGAAVADAMLGRFKSIQPLGIASEAGYEYSARQPRGVQPIAATYFNEPGWPNFSPRAPFNPYAVQASYQGNINTIPEIPMRGRNGNIDEYLLQGSIIAEAIVGRLASWEPRRQTVEAVGRMEPQETTRGREVQAVPAPKEEGDRLQTLASYSFAGALIADAITGRLRGVQPPEQAAASIGRIGEARPQPAERAVFTPARQPEAAMGLQTLASYSFAGALIADAITGRLGGVRSKELLDLMQSQEENRSKTKNSETLLEAKEAPEGSQNKALQEAVFSKQFATAMQAASKEKGQDATNRQLEEILSRLSVVMTEVASAANEAGRNIKQAATVMSEPVEVIMPQPPAMNVGRA